MRRLTLKALCLGSLSAGIARAEGFGVCGFYQEVYRRDIERKIRGGVPFELMAVLLQGDQVVYKRVIHLSYDLWDEVITVKEDERTLKKIPLKQGLSEVCRFLEPQGQEFGRGVRYAYKLLLNPMWAGRVARLKASAASPGGDVGILHVNWDRVARELDPETTLLTQEVKL